MYHLLLEEIIKRARNCQAASLPDSAHKRLHLSGSHVSSCTLLNVTEQFTIQGHISKTILIFFVVVQLCTQCLGVFNMFLFLFANKLETF